VDAERRSVAQLNNYAPGEAIGEKVSALAE
jgi:hypothetical protein